MRRGSLLCLALAGCDETLDPVGATGSGGTTTSSSSQSASSGGSGGGGGALPCQCGLCPEAAITAPESYVGATSGRGEREAECAASGGPEVVVSLEAGATALYNFSTAGSSFDTVLEVVDAASCERLACDDNANSMFGHDSSHALVPLVGGETVLIVVDGPSGQDGDFRLTVVESGACQPTELDGELPISLTRDIALEVDDFAAPCALSNGPDAIFRFEAPATGDYLVDTLGSAFDTILYAAAETCEGASLGCNDDMTGQSSEIELSLAAGEVVLLFVDSFASVEEGNFTLRVIGQ